MSLPTRTEERVERSGGLLNRLRRSRRAEPSPPVSGVDHGAWAIDRIVRALATACERENRAVPAAQAIVLGPDVVRIHLRTPDERPPAGWAAAEDGRTWHAQLRMLQSANVVESAQEPYPRLVSIGYGAGGFALVNLGQAGGVVGLEGDSRQAKTLAFDWTRELTTSPWARGVQVVRVGFKPGTSVPGVALEAKSLADAEVALDDDAGGVLMLAGMPGGRDGERVRALAEDPEGRWSVVVVGRTDTPRWRFTVDAAGMLDTGLLDGKVARRWDPSIGTPVFEDTATISVVRPGSVRRRGGPSTRTWVILASVTAVVLLGAAAVLAIPMLRGESDKGTPVPPGDDVVADAPKEVPAGGAGVVRGLASGLCLDGDSDPVMALNGEPTGGHAFTNTCNDAATQTWSEGPLLSEDRPRAGDLYRLVNPASGFCLDTNGDLIYTLPCLNPNQFQMWQRIVVPSPQGSGSDPGDTVLAYRNVGSDKCLSIALADQILQVAPCPSSSTWPSDMMFIRPA